MDEPKLSEELRGMQQEPLLPIEKRLVAWSLALGLALIAILAVLSETLFGPP
jgi:hypothetical protein